MGDAEHTEEVNHLSFADDTSLLSEPNERLFFISDAFC